jgi:hypothetical protein
MSQRGQMEDTNKIQFSFSWLALQLLGKGLYSNPWSALSELVANGLDAGASKVYVFVDATDKEKAVIEIFDNGSGMSLVDLNTYATVGHNKRASGPSGDDDVATAPMGRKGIGKLAALYLSPYFQLRTRRGGADSTWSLDVRANKVNDDDNPALSREDTLKDSPNIGLWETFDTGTFLSLREVDLRGHGPQALTALGSRLANQFLLTARSTPAQILMHVRTDDPNEVINFVPVHKNIAFRNFAYMRVHGLEHLGIDSPSEEVARTVEVDAPGLRNDVFIHEPQVKAFEPEPDESFEGWDELRNEINGKERTFAGRDYDLTGWIGIHTSIDNESAKRNDDRFTKNRFYNPAQLRLYVRGKLASDRLLNQLGITAAYLNYIEGELSFDLLDDDEMPDIATSNRQDFDETDDRITLLRAIVRPLVRSLMNDRQALASRIRKQIQDKKDEQETESKAVFSDQLGRELMNYAELSDDTRTKIHMLTTNKIKGDVKPKTMFKVFISHASADKRFADMIYALLLHKGVLADEVFYTSKEGEVQQYIDKTSLARNIRTNITHANTMMFYLTSHHFMNSQYCMFEGGAGWATRAVSELTLLNLTYEAVPKFLDEGASLISLFAKENKLELREDVHNFLVEGVLNPMIRHLNQGRKISGEPMIAEFSVPAIPSKVDRQRAGKQLTDYFDVDVIEHWETYVDDGIDSYISDYPWPA